MAFIEIGLNAGKQTNLLVTKFKLGWTGNANLLAGDYVNNITIDYTIN